ncbi:MAG TPA: LysM domain-containing protein [Polyangiaceae bacterium]|nr:LysM domain-containing protein [Polyangiaceae bacterium]
MGTLHAVRQGECLVTIARQYGFSDYKAIYDHPANAAFKKARPDPNQIFPGDRLAIPDQVPRTYSRATGGELGVPIRCTTQARRLGQPRRRRAYGVWTDVLFGIGTTEPSTGSSRALRIAHHWTAKQ